MKTVRVTVWRIQYKDGLIVDHPGSATKDEIEQHAKRCDGISYARETKNVDIPDMNDIIADTLKEFDIEPNPERIAQYYSLLNNKSALRRWIQTIKMLG